MASFGLFAADDEGSVAAGVVNAAAGAPAAAAAGGGVHRRAHVSAWAVKGVRIAGNVVSALALLLPM
jgi:hypothetical protein